MAPTRPGRQLIGLERVRVREVVRRERGLVELAVEPAEPGQRSVLAIALPALGDYRWRVGQQVLVNTTAGSLGLGSGGFHLAVVPDPLELPCAPASWSRRLGHIVKLRYTPLQLAVRACEEPGGPYHRSLRDCDTLNDLPVAVLGLHSMLGPLAAAFKWQTTCAGNSARIAFVMTDSASLPAAVSRQLHRLRRLRLVDLTVTAGQAFGGDLEAVHPASALAACVRAGADAAVVGPGPGIVGTRTRLGTTALEVASLCDLVGALGGQAVVPLRLSFADLRWRHRVVSHHVLTALGRLAARPARVVIPAGLGRAARRQALARLAAAGVLKRHHVAEVASPPPQVLLELLEGHWDSMGRRFPEDPHLFLAAAAAGRYLAGLTAAGPGGDR
mgnify:CR=1 FL=1